jgi:DNA adenine methylase
LSKKSHYTHNNITTSQTLSYPFVKWAGGKTQLLPELDRVIPSEFDRYFEPFLGGAALFFHLISNRNRFSPYLSDLNKELITTYKIVKDNVKELLQLLKRYDAAYRKAPSGYYYELRDRLKPSNDIERAARFITLNKTCYNGLYRVNRGGKFNVPIGRYHNPLICDSNNLENVSHALRYSKAIILAGDYRQIILENAQKGDFIYLDPPYNPTSSTSNFTGYTDYGFGNNDQEQLASIFRKLDDRNCMVLLSNSDTPFIRELYSDFVSFIKEVNSLRAINCKGSKRAGHKELLIRNYPDNV